MVQPGPVAILAKALTATEHTEWDEVGTSMTSVPLLCSMLDWLLSLAAFNVTLAR